MSTRKTAKKTSKRQTKKSSTNAKKKTAKKVSKASAKAAKKKTSKVKTKKSVQAKEEAYDPTSELFVAIHNLTVEVKKLVEVLSNKNIAYNATKVVESFGQVEAKGTLPAEKEVEANDPQLDFGLFDEAPVIPPMDEEGPSYTLEDVTQKLQELGAQKGLQAVKELLGEFEAKKVSDLKELQYNFIVERANEILG